MAHFPEILLGQAGSVVKKTWATPVSPVTAAQDTETLQFIAPWSGFLNTLFRSCLQAFSLEVLGHLEFVQHVDPVLFFLDLYLPGSYTASLSQVWVGHINGSDNEGTRPALPVLDLLWLGFCASVYLPSSSISSNNVVLESAAVTFNLNIFFNSFII